MLIQVNIGNEEQKGGINPQELESFLAEVSEFEGIRVKGLMCSTLCFAGRVKPYFEEMANLAKIKQKNIRELRWKSFQWE